MRGVREPLSNCRKEWLQYANWEVRRPCRLKPVSALCSSQASQGEYDRSRSVYERALDVDARSVTLWLSYTEMELKARNVQHARNLFDRAVTLLPRIDQLWYKYVYLEELLGNVVGALLVAVPAVYFYLGDYDFRASKRIRSVEEGEGINELVVNGAEEGADKRSE